MYIFIREDLSKPQQIVQASHAALEAGFTFQKPKTTTHIVLIGTKNQAELRETAEYLERHGIEFEMFFEPDYDTGYTAIATRPLFGKERRPLKRFQLLKEKDND